MHVAFLGLGRMGTAMAGHLIDSDVVDGPLVVWNRSEGKAGELVDRGAREASSPAEAAKDADVVVLMLHDGDSVREVLFGDDGVAGSARPGTRVVDATTIGPTATRSIAEQAQQAGLTYLDAPVAGSVGPASNGQLGVFVGGGEDDVEAVRPLLELWGDPDRVERTGGTGSGSALKLVVNLALGIAAQGVGETLRLADDLGVDRGQAMDALSSSAFGWTLGQKRSLVDAGDYSAPSFSVDLIAKDLQLAVDEASRELPVTADVLTTTKGLQDDGHGGDDYAAIIGRVADGS